MNERTDYDVVVVGGGTGGLVSAISAAEAGASVLMLEASSREERGGNSRFASGVYRVAHQGAEDLKPLVGDNSGLPWESMLIEPYDEDRFFDDIWAVTGGQADPDLLRLVVQHSGDTARWLHGLGMKWGLSHTKFMSTSDLKPGEVIRLPPGGELIADGNGVQSVESLYAAAEERGIEIWYDSPAVDLVMDGFRVTGVAIVRDGHGMAVTGRAVVLASGSIEGSAEARLRYLGPGWDLVRVRGTRYNTGLMLDRAITAGAAVSGHWSGVHSVAVDAASPQFGDLAIGDTNARYSYPYGVTVNIEGKRFFDEGKDEMNYTYAEVGRLLLGQPKVLAAQLFDAKTVGLLEPRYSTGTPVVADTHEELAKGLGFDVEGLVATLAEYNAACQPAEFDPYRKDGVAARPSGQPQKSNWALPLDTPPYYGYKVTTGVTFAFAGLSIDEHSRVQSITAEPMPGLYACGELAGGVIAHNVPGGTGLIKSAVTGRLAGQHAAEFARERS